MKKITLIISIIGLLAFISCKKDETKATLKSAPGAAVLTIPGGSDLLLKKVDSAVMLTYNWTKVDFGIAVVVTYNVQFDKQGNNFKDATSIGTVINATTLSVMTADLNNKLLPMEFDPSKPDPLALEFRVVATVNPYVNPVNSASAAQNITPYYVPIIYPLLFVPGSYQGWNPADSTTSIASVKSNDMYEGYIWFGMTPTNFKYCQGPSWTTNWGDDGADGTLDPNGANIVATTAGYYKLNVNLVAKTHTFVKTAWSIIGDASGGWDVDKDMAYDSIAKTWSLTLDLTAANIKFRANHAWDINYGDDGANGTLDPGGANIAVPIAGNYTVVMNLSKPIYRYKLTKNE